MGCAERERLWIQYEAALDVFCDVVDRLPSDPTSSASSRIMIAKAAKAACVYARTAWEDHRRVHRCDGNHLVRAAGSSPQA